MLRFAALFFILLQICFSAVFAQEQAVKALTSVDTSSPRASLKSFMDAMNDYMKNMADYPDLSENALDSAVRILDTSKLGPIGREQEAKEAAIFLKEVIDRIYIPNWAEVPDLSADTADVKKWRLANTDIILFRIESGEYAGEFLFSADTVLRAQSYYERVKHLAYLPESGQGAAYRDNYFLQFLPKKWQQKLSKSKNTKYLLLVLLFVIGLLFRKFLSLVFNRFSKISSSSKYAFDFSVLHSVQKPLSWLILSILWFLSMHLLGFDGLEKQVLSTILQILIGFFSIYVSYSLVDVFLHYLKMASKKAQIPIDDNLFAALSKLIKIFTFIFALLVVMQNFGINVMSILTGLGLGGLAFALAAQDTCANLFGSMMIFADRPFRVGDYIKIADIEGNVEHVGFRSTRIRTFYGSVVSIPNQVVASANIDNMGERVYRRIRFSLGIAYSTPTLKIQEFIESIRLLLNTNSLIQKQDLNVSFESMGDFSLNILVNYFVQAGNLGEESMVRQEVYLKIMDIAKEQGIEFAFPTQSLHIETLPKEYLP